MKKMTLAQKKRRLKEIKADFDALPVVLKREPKWVQDAYRRMKTSKKPGTVLTSERQKEILARGKLVQKMIVRPRVPADELPGEWVKLPPMKWPEWLPVEVPKNVVLFLRTTKCSKWAADIILRMWRECPHETDNYKIYEQSAWSETLVRLGYTEDA